MKDCKECKIAEWIWKYAKEDMVQSMQDNSLKIKELAESNSIKNMSKIVELEELNRELISSTMAIFFIAKAIRAGIKSESEENSNG